MEDVKLAVEEVEPSTAVYCVVRGCFVRPTHERPGADGSTRLQLLVNCGDHLQLWEPVDDTLEFRQSFYLFEHIDHADLVPASFGLFGPDSTDAVLLFTFDGRCALFNLELQTHRDQLPPGTTAPSTPGPYVLTEAACLTLPIPALRNGLMPKRLGGVCSSGVAPVSKRTAMKSSARAVVVAAFNMGMLHVITLHTVAGARNANGGTGPSTSSPTSTAAGSKANGSCSSDGGSGDGDPLMMCAVVLIQDTPLYGMPPGFDDLEVMAHMSHVHDMCFMPPPERDAYEPPLLVVLHKLERSGGLSFTMDCLALELKFGGEEGAGAKGDKGGTGKAAAAAAAAAAGGSTGAGASGSGSSQGAGGGPGGASGSGAAAAPSTSTCSAVAWAAAQTASNAGGASGSGGPADDVAPLRAELMRGPWVARFLHPTTTVITPFPGVRSAGLPAGVVAVSSISATLYCRPPTLGPIMLAAATAEAAARRAAAEDPGPPLGDFSTLDPFDDAAVSALFDRWFGKDFLEDAAIEFAEAEATVRRIQLVSYALEGMPLTAEQLAPGVLLIGDAAAGLTLLHTAGRQPWVARVLPDLPGPPPLPPPAMPKAIAYLHGAAVVPGAADAAGPDKGVSEGNVGSMVSEREPEGLLFVGSDCSSAQVLFVPMAHLSPAAEPPPPPPPPPQQQPPLATTAAAKGTAVGEGQRPGRGKAEGQQRKQQTATGAVGARAGPGEAAKAEEEEEDVEELPPPLPELRWPVSELAVIKSLAPVTDVAVVPDTSGADDPWLVASCGRNAAGRLVRARLAAGMQPYMSDGPRVPDGCRMYPLRLETSTPVGEGRRAGPFPFPGHTHIAFSFEAAGRTDVLCVAGTAGASGGGEFTQVELPGLNHGSASLLVADVAGRRLVQVLQSGIRVLQPLYEGAGLAVEWRAPEPLSLAAHSGCILAAASRNRLHLLRIDPGTGAVRTLSDMEQLPAQLSALALYRLPPPQQHPALRKSAVAEPSAAEALAEADATFVLMGYWLTNRVEVAAVADPTRQLLELQLAEDATPRSLAVLELPSYGTAVTAAAGTVRPPVLLAGTHTGRLLMWQLSEAPVASPTRQWRLGPCYSLRVSQVSVELQTVPVSGPAPAVRPRSGGSGGGSSTSGGGGGGYVYVHSHSGAIIRPRLQAAAATVAVAAASAPPPPLEQLVEVVRVHGSEVLQAVCHVSTVTMPDSTCWVTRDGQLLFGRIDPRVRLRWSTAFVGETIHSFAYHAASHCLVALCESYPVADNSLRVIEVNSMQQVMSMRLSYGHFHAAVTVGPLPCTTGKKAAVARRRRGGGGSSGTAVQTAGGGGGAAATAAAAAAEPEKEFVVLASYLSLDSSCDPEVSKHVEGAQLLYGTLSFMELVAKPAPDGSNATQYSLLLQGSCLVPSVPTSLAIARPSPYAPPAATGAGGAALAGSSLLPAKAAAPPAPAAEGAGSSSDLVDMPYLLVGCQGRVYLYQIYVDDGRHRGDRAVKRALQLVDQMDELNLPLPRNYAEVQVGLQEVDRLIKKRLAEEAKVAASAAAAAAAAGGSGDAVGGPDAMSTEGVGLGGGEDEELAEDESELPGPQVNWEERLKALEEEEKEENVEYKYGLGLMVQPDSEDEEYFRQWVQEQGLEGEQAKEVATQAARTVKMLRKRLEKEDMLAAEAAAAATDGGGGGGGSDWDSDVDYDDESSDGDDSDNGHRLGGGQYPPPRSRRRRIGPSIRQLLRDLERDWSQHVAVREVDVAETFGGACVMSLTCLSYDGGSGGGGGVGGSLVLASDHLGSVTVMRLVANSRGAALISCAADRHPVYAQAAAWLDPDHILVAVHPHGMAVLRRDAAVEEEVMMAAQRQAVADFEAGVNRQRPHQTVEQVWETGPAGAGPARPGGTGGTAAGAGASSANSAGAGPSTAGATGAGTDRFSLDDLRLLKPRLEATPGLTLEAACRVRHLVTRMCRARLGLRLQPHPRQQQQQQQQRQRQQAREQQKQQQPAAAPRLPPIASSGAAFSSKTGQDPPPGVTGLQQQQQHHHCDTNQWDPRDLLLSFSNSGYVSAVRLQQQVPAAAPTAATALPPLAKLARLQHAVSSLDPTDTALLTGVDSESYSLSYSWPLVVPREMAAGAGLAGFGSSTVADEAGTRRAAPPVRPPSASPSAASSRPNGSAAAADDDLMALEAEAEALAAGCVDGTVLRLLLAAAEAQLQRDAEAEAVAAAAAGGSAAGGGGMGLSRRAASAGGGGRVASLLRRLAREVTGLADLGSLVVLLQRSSVAGVS